ncbi:DUF962 domain-containing protein [Labilithrix luteola]|nr:Mpo1-like protein [Labilithrix luteola]
MRSLVDHLSNYADYHRDRRNIATHFVGIPMIVFGIEAFLARPALPLGGTSVSVAMVATLLAMVFYFVLDRRFGVAMTAFFGASFWLGSVIAAQSTTLWLVGATSLFLGGWVIQFVGHYFEGKKPAFVDDLIGLLVGPLFIVAEAGFALGMRRELREEIERRSGPTRGRSLALSTDGNR